MRTISFKDWTLGVLVLYGVAARCQDLTDSIRGIARGARGTVGVAFKISGEPGYAGINTTAHFPMQSVYKFHLALYFLHEVDKKRLTLDQAIPVDSADWEPKEYSPLRDRYKTPPPAIPLRELLRAIVVNSDNVACDILFRKAGGPPAVSAYIKSLGVTGIAIVATEAEMHHSWPVQYGNWTTPADMVTLLEKFDKGKILTPSSTRLLYKWMSESPRVSGRIKGMLDRGTPVAHKPGTSDVSSEGVAAATNDVGIITLPDHRHLVVAVFVSDSRADEATRDYVIARIACDIFRVYTLEKR